MRESSRPLMAAFGALPLVVCLAACGSDESADAPVVPENHAAVQLHTMGSVDEASTAAHDAGINFVCGTFTAPGQSDTTDTSACMVSDEGVVAVIAFDSSADMTFIVSGPAIEGEVTVPVEATDVHGVEAGPGQLTLSIKTGDTVIGTVTFGA